MYIKEYEIRWSDIDANRHVANSSYVDLFSQTRMSFLLEKGFSHFQFAKHNFGPIVFSEEMHYIKEIHPNAKVKVSLELLAHNLDFTQVKFAHCLFNEKEQLSVYSEVFFGWLDMSTRKLVAPPKPLLEIVDHLGKSEKFHLLPEGINLKNDKVPYGKQLK